MESLTDVVRAIILARLPDVDSFFGIDLKTGSMMIAAIGVVHPMAYGCSFFMPMSYLLLTIWILVALSFAASLILFCGLLNNNTMLCTIWIWYTVVFVIAMLIMMLLLAIVFTSKKQKGRVFVLLFGTLWYILTIYFILVVNSHCKNLDAPTTSNPPETHTTPISFNPPDELKALRKARAM